MTAEGLDKDAMRKVNFKTDMPQIKDAEIEFMKRIEIQNLQRVEKLRKMKRKSNAIGGLIFGGVLGIYLYTMYAVKQESFLDFEPPKDEEKK